MRHSRPNRKAARGVDNERTADVLQVALASYDRKELRVQKNKSVRTMQTAGLLQLLQSELVLPGKKDLPYHKYNWTVLVSEA